MTNNRFYLDEEGTVIVKLSRADGLGISGIRKLGIDQMIISTEKNKIVKTRALKLKLECYYGIEDKKATLISNCKKKIYH
jgi:Low specificity phosphatase (HAD superfamily)